MQCRWDVGSHWPETVYAYVGGHEASQDAADGPSTPFARPPVTQEKDPPLRPTDHPSLYLIYMFSYPLLSGYTYPLKQKGVTGRTILGTDDPVAERGPSHPIPYKLGQLLGPHEPAFRKEEP